MAENPDRIEVLPVLPSLDIQQTFDFYTTLLGFSEVVYRADDYLILRRPDMELHFRLTDDRTLCERTSVYLRGGGIGDLHREFSERDVPTLTPMAVRAWNMEEFYIHDPHGNLLRFARIPKR
ncbi:VOC family protein [Shinella kummerowiae]|uniref:VOC family protein n=1 Tax=Shinella kummerowiae TaxID=417745 RepID=A0A6N8S5U3_9HYPH|nr:VOC family protein [Shinella kummerowiae]MXN44414.1 VOC family protein [Shinella kummerowiae]